VYKDPRRRKVAIISLLGNNILKEKVMRRMYVPAMILLLFLLPGLSFAGDQMGRRPNRSEMFESKPDMLNRTPRRLGVDSQGNTSILVPNHSKGYIGVDSKGKALIITPLRGNLGVDSSGNIWTMTPR
jgi:hypothetical protein